MFRARRTALGSEGSRTTIGGRSFSSITGVKEEEVKEEDESRSNSVEAAFRNLLGRRGEDNASWSSPSPPIPMTIAVRFSRTKRVSKGGSKRGEVVVVVAVPVEEEESGTPTEDGAVAIAAEVGGERSNRGSQEAVSGTSSYIGDASRASSSFALRPEDTEEATRSEEARPSTGVVQGVARA